MTATLKFKIAVVIPALDEAQHLPLLLDSLHRAGISRRWIWLADGGSRDATVDIAKKKGVRVVVSERGRGKQLHAGAQLAAEAKPDILLFVHADSEIEESAVQKLERCFVDPNIGFACFKSSIDHPKLIYRLIEWLIDRRTRITHLPYGELGLALRPGAYRWAGGYPPWPLFEEVGLAQRLKKNTRFFQIDLPLRTSARRWEEGGPVLVSLRNWAIMVLYLFGVSPFFLAKFYSFVKAPLARQKA